MWWNFNIDLFFNRLCIFCTCVAELLINRSKHLQEFFWPTFDYCSIKSMKQMPILHLFQPVEERSSCLFEIKALKWEWFSPPNVVLPPPLRYCLIWSYMIIHFDFFHSSDIGMHENTSDKFQRPPVLHASFDQPILWWVWPPVSILLTHIWRDTFKGVCIYVSSQCICSGIPRLLSRELNYYPHSLEWHNISELLQ